MTKLFVDSSAVATGLRSADCLALPEAVQIIKNTCAEQGENHAEEQKLFEAVGFYPR